MRIIRYPFNEKQTGYLYQTLVEREGIMVYPTETFYAIGCDARKSESVNRIYQLKNRKRTSPLLVLINSWDMAREYITFENDDQIAFLRQFWPGPLTAILPMKGGLAPELNYQNSVVGFRMTDSDVARALITIIGAPIVGTSANISNQRETTRMSETRGYFGDQVEIYVDGGETPGEAPSTIIDMSRPKPYPIIRQGKLTFGERD